MEFHAAFFSRTNKTRTEMGAHYNTQGKKMIKQNKKKWISYFFNIEEKYNLFKIVHLCDVYVRLPSEIT